MNKSDLKDGVVVKLRNGSYRFYIEDNLYWYYGLDLIQYDSMKNYDDNLNNISNKILDIVEVFYMDELIWERPKEVDWTKVPFGTKVRAWWIEDEKDKTEGKFLAYDEYGNRELQFYILYPIEDGLVEANWFDCCELIEEE